jgi:predicted O-linked N-acetylglucosamine transferase (SPINDLY family)
MSLYQDFCNIVQIGETARLADFIETHAGALATADFGWQVYHKAYELFMRSGKIKDALYYFNKRLELNFEVDLANQFALLCTTHQHYFMGGKWFNIILKYDPDNIAALSNHGKYSMVLLGQPRAHAAMTQAYKLMKPCRPFLREDFINGFSSVYLCNVMYNYEYTNMDIVRIMKDWHNEFEKNYYDHQYARQLQFKEIYGTTGANGGKRSDIAARKRRLRIGYISSDFRKHPMGLFVYGILREHSRTLFDVYCYNNMYEDFFTQKLKEAHPELKWCDISKLSDEDIYTLIVKDEIDILVDMMGLTNGVRLKTLYLKPAPLILSYIAFPCTIGARCIDYKIACPVSIPQSMDAEYGEKILRLDNGFLTYTPPFDYQVPKKVPLRSENVVHLSCYNNTQKFSPKLLDVFASVLLNLPNAILHLRYYHYMDPNVSEFYYQQFESRGIARSQLEIAFDPNMSLLQLYESIDIALDSFPFNGETVTMEALWTGTPVITLLGNSYMSRAGASILTQLGHPEWIAKDELNYISKVVSLANDRAQLNRIHQSLHEEFMKSPLGDAKRFIASYERGILSAWDEKMNELSPTVLTTTSVSAPSRA